MGQIKVEKAPIEGLYIIEPTVHGDSRGYFMETYNQNDMHDAGLDMVFVQDNQSMSTKGVLRGLHFQKQFPQGKLVRVIKGSVFDVAVDLRKDSKTYGNGSGLSLPLKIRNSFTFRKGLRMDFWCLAKPLNFAIKSPISITQVMREVLRGMTRNSVLSGHSLLVNITAVRRLTGTFWRTAQHLI